MEIMRTGKLAQNHALLQASRTNIVICSGCSNTEAASFVLVGCYLILHEGRQLESVKALFHNRMPGPDLHVAQSTGDSSIGFACSADSSDVWDALDHAVRLGWLSPTAPDAEPALDLEEQAHYARPANGGVHIVVPGKLLFLREPDCHLPPGRDWADAEAADGTAARRFSPAFCASLLSALDVSVGVGPVATGGQAAVGLPQEEELARDHDVHAAVGRAGVVRLLLQVQRGLGVGGGWGQPAETDGMVEGIPDVRGVS